VVEVAVGDGVSDAAGLGLARALEDAAVGLADGVAVALVDGVAVELADGTVASELLATGVAAPLEVHAVSSSAPRLRVTVRFIRYLSLHPSDGPPASSWTE
jgi:hypothetical protein